MKVKTNNEIRTIHEMQDMWTWMCEQFGTPSAHNSNRTRWTYGKDHPGFLGSEIIDGPWDIEWFDFQHEEDAVLFTLRWS
jgi:hypothetical protein